MSDKEALECGLWALRNMAQSGNPEAAAVVAEVERLRAEIAALQRRVIQPGPCSAQGGCDCEADGEGQS